MTETKVRRGEVFTTGEVAKVCHVATHTVNRWVDTGAMRGYRLPGTHKQRRVTRDALLAFLKEHGMPTGALENFSAVLLVGVPAAVELDPTRFAVARAGGAFGAGAAVAVTRPDVAVVDLAVGRADALAVLTALRALPGGVPVVALGHDTDSVPELLEDGFAEALSHPFDPAALAVVVERLARGK